MNKLYTQHDGRVVNVNRQFSHIMALALDPRTQYKEGVIRSITSREGDVTVKGYIDRSELHKVKGDSLENFEIGEQLQIKNETETINQLREDNLDFIGLEDPDIWIDEENDILHLYFTLPLINKVEENKTKIHLGHAVGKNLDSLEMTLPILTADKQGGAKELSIAPINKKGFRYNLVESGKEETDFTYSVVRLAIVEAP